LRAGWVLAHVLTSRDGWGKPRVSLLVDELLKRDVKHFFKRLLNTTVVQTNGGSDLGLLNFMLENIVRIQHPYFLNLLRAYLFASPESYDLVYDLRRDPILGTHISVTALRIACVTDLIPVWVVKTILEANVSVDSLDDSGDSALMLTLSENTASSAAKTKYLLDYGANIDIYNESMLNSIHIAVLGQNVDGLRLVLQARKERIRLQQPFEIVEYGSFLRERGALNPDPLHFTDSMFRSPLTIALNYACVPNDVCSEMMQMLVAAGASADSDVHRITHQNTAKSPLVGAGTVSVVEVVPSCYGVMSCMISGGSFEVSMCVHKQNYCVEQGMDLDVLSSCIDMSQSVIPAVSPTEVFDPDYVFMRRCTQRIEFSGDVDGLDFDIHFNTSDHTDYDAYEISSNMSAAYKLAIRFPRSPIDGNWRDQLPRGHVFSSMVTVYNGHTLAHRAVLCEFPNLLLKTVETARMFCNPLRRCANGLTASETLAMVLKGVVTTRDMKNLAKSMRKDQEEMTTYIFKDALLDDAKPNTRQKKRTQTLHDVKSPFHLLSDDICRIILGFM
jgi:hypothetical protein